MNEKRAHHPRAESNKPLIIGFCISLALLLVTYWIATGSFLSGPSLLVSLLGLACTQALVQLILFLHLGVEPRPRWNLITFLFLVIIIVVVVGGSLWIMYNLNYHMMLPHG